MLDEHIAFEAAFVIFNALALDLCIDTKSSI